MNTRIGEWVDDRVSDFNGQRVFSLEERMICVKANSNFGGNFYICSLMITFYIKL